MTHSTCLVLMGVSGAGKTTVGRLLADALGGRFVDGDDLHPETNIAKMRRGIALTDADRGPWLDAVAAAIAGHDEVAPLVVACSALKRRYRHRLGDGFRLIYLKCGKDVIARRLRGRRGHFMPETLLESQFATLEVPAPADDALVVDAARPPAEIVAAIVAALGG